MFRPSHRQCSVRVVFGVGWGVQWDDMWCSATNFVFGYGDGWTIKMGLVGSSGSVKHSIDGTFPCTSEVVSLRDPK